MKRVAIVGCGGYGGVGMVELLLGHGGVEVAALLDVADVGKPLAEIYPHLHGLFDGIIRHVDEHDPSSVDLVFFATPDGVGQAMAPRYVAAGAKVVDYSGDYRFDSAPLYAEYASRIGRETTHKAPDLLPRSAYGLTEWHREEIRRAAVVGNPGCFAVACIMGLAPAVKHGLVEPEGLVCDAKTGVSGAGKKPSPGFHFPARHECMNAYRIGKHQHVMEIERELSALAGRPIRVTFTPQVVPLVRGIMATLYGTLVQGLTASDVAACYRETYKDERFVRVFTKGEPVSSTDVRGSNFVNLSVNVDERTRRLVVVSYIDNLVKGQAGSALQNMNVLLGLEETRGLLAPGRYP